MKLDFALRSCFSLSFLVFLTFESSIERGVTHNGRHLVGVPFSALACILAMGQTVGGTVKNSTQIVLGASISCFACYLALLAFGDVTIPPQGLYPLLWCYTFLMSLIDLPSLGLLGKRVGLSLITIILIPASINGTTSSSVWWLFSDVLFGCSCALVGVVFPWPRLASLELESLACRGAILVGSSFEDLLVAWRYHSLAQFRKSAPPHRDAEMTQIDSSMHYPTARASSNRHWRLLRNVYRALSTMRLGATTLLQWQQGHSRCSTRSLRDELLRVVREDLAQMHTRAIEARYGPHFRRAQARHGAFIILLEELTSAQNTIEGRFAAITELLNSGLSLDVTKAFFSLPEWRNSLAQLGKKSNDCIKALGIWLSSSGHRNETLRMHCILLTQAVSAFDKSYLMARQRSYYENSQSVKIVPEVVLAMNSLVFYLQRFAGLLIDFCEDQLQVEMQAEHLVLGLPPLPRFSLSAAWPQRRQLLSSLSIASSITIAGYYGLANTRGVPFLASFTIAYLQSSTAGRNVATSLCRVGGTAAACIYTIMIVLVAESLHDRFSERLFISFATIAFLFPCSLVRATQLAGYAGTVAGFTAAILLLAPPLEISVIVDRLIDTIVGVAIFLLFELTLSATYTERLLLEVLRVSIASLEPQFSEVIADFVQAAQAAENNHDSGSNRSRSRSRSRGTIVTQTQGLQQQQQHPQQLLKLYGTEELLFASFELTGSSPSALLEKVFESTRLCHEYLVQLNHIASEMGRSSTCQSLAVFPIHTILESLDGPCSAALQAVLSMQQYVSTATESAPLTRSPLLLAPRIPSPALLSGLLHGFGSPNSPDAILLQLRACEEQTVNRFYAIAQTLQDPLEEELGTGDDLPRGTEVSNLEIELTCAFLAGIIDFIGALRALVPSVAALRDHRTVERALG